MRASEATAGNSATSCRRARSVRVWPPRRLLVADRLQKMAQGYVSPESFTHGTSAQRTAWFKRGLNSGKCPDCDTFRQ